MPGCRLACGDLRRLTGNGSALEVVHDDALYKSTTLLYFTFKLWNGLPPQLHQPDVELGQLKRLLKTFLFCGCGAL